MFVVQLARNINMSATQGHVDKKIKTPCISQLSYNSNQTALQCRELSYTIQTAAVRHCSNAYQAPVSINCIYRLQFYNKYSTRCW